MTMATYPRAQLLRIIRLAPRLRLAVTGTRNTFLPLPRRDFSLAPFGHLYQYAIPQGRTASQRRWYASETLNVQELEQRVLNVLKAFDKVNPEKVTTEAHFMNDLGMDSLDAVEVVMAFEDEFGVEISDEEAEKIFSCKDAIELLKSKLHLK